MNRIDLNLSNKTILSQQIQQSLELLTLSQNELEKRIDEEIENNPFLRKKDCESTFRYIYSINEIKGTQGYDRKKDCDISLKEDLLDQLGYIEGLKEIELYKYVINLLDGNGYLRLKKSSIAFDLSISETRVNEIISIIQSLDPPGVGAASFQECLCLQIERKHKKNQCAYDICKFYLEEVARGQIKNIVKKSGYSIDEIENAIAEIKKLNPKPGNGYRQDEIAFVYPEAEVIIGEDHLEIHYLYVNSCDLEVVTIDCNTTSLNQKEKEFIQSKKNDAQRMVSKLTFRRKTIKNVIELLVEIQKDYFYRGGEGIVPLQMNEVADILQISQSTVSRAVNGKYILFQNQMIPIKSLFSRSLDQDNSVADIKNRIQELIEKENKRKPYSDAKIADKLKALGIKISRRTVAKYRDELKILTASLRKEM